MNDMNTMHNMEGMDDSMHTMEGVGGMDQSMMMPIGPMLWGYDVIILLMIASGVFYLISAISIWKLYLKDKNELIGALFYFLVYQAISMFFMGVEMQTMNMLYSNIAALSIFIGSAYMLKFPLSSLSESKRKNIFMIVLIVLLGVFAWFMQTPARQMELMHGVLWYDLVVNGIIVGGSMLVYGFKAIEAVTRKKAIGGGVGVVTCCVVANTAMITGAMLTSTIFAFLAPVIILFSLKSVASKLSQSQNPSVPPATSTTPPTPTTPVSSTI